MPYIFILPGKTFAILRLTVCLIVYFEYFTSLDSCRSNFKFDFCKKRKKKKKQKRKKLLRERALFNRLNYSFFFFFFFPSTFDTRNTKRKRFNGANDASPHNETMDTRFRSRFVSFFATLTNANVHRRDCWLCHSFWRT